MWTSGLKFAKNGNFGYKFAPKGVYPLIRFVQNFAWGRASQDTLPRQFDYCSFKNVALRSHKSPKMEIFDKNLPLGENFGGR